MNKRISSAINQAMFCGVIALGLALIFFEAIK